MNFIVNRDEEVATTPGNFVVNPTTTVGDLKKQFQSLYGGYLKVYNGRSIASDDEKLVDIGAKTGEFSCRASRTVGSFVEAMKETFGLKVKVWTSDEWLTVLDGITLSKVRDLPKQATKAVLEAYESYKRENREEQEPSEKEIKMEDEKTPKDIHITELPIKKFKFYIYPVHCDYIQFKYFLYEELGIGAGFFVAAKSPNGGAYKNPLEDNIYISSFLDGPGEAYGYMEEGNKDASLEILHYGRIMVAWHDEEDENIDFEEEVCNLQAGLTLIFKKYSKDLYGEFLDYSGPEIIYELTFTDGEDKQLNQYKFRIFRNEKNEWSSEELKDE